MVRGGIIGKESVEQRRRVFSGFLMIWASYSHTLLSWWFCAISPFGFLLMAWASLDMSLSRIIVCTITVVCTISCSVPSRSLDALLTTPRPLGSSTWLQSIS